MIQEGFWGYLMDRGRVRSPSKKKNYSFLKTKIFKQNECGLCPPPPSFYKNTSNIKKKKYGEDLKWFYFSKRLANSIFCCISIYSDRMKLKGSLRLTRPKFFCGLNLKIAFCPPILFSRFVWKIDQFIFLVTNDIF